MKDVEELFALTTTEGWKLLCKEAEDKIEMIKEMMATQALDQYRLGILQGRIVGYRDILALRGQMELALNEANEDHNE